MIQTKHLFLAIVLAVLAATGAHTQRWKQEGLNRQAEMVLDLASATDYARSTSRTVDQVIEQEYKPFGVSSLVVSELKWDDLENRGVATLISGLQLTLTRPNLNHDVKIDPSKSYVLFLGEDSKEKARWSKLITEQMSLAIGPKLVREKPGLVEIDLPLRQIQTIGLGFPMDDLKAYEKKGYKLWLRPENKPAFQDNEIKKDFELMSGLTSWQGVIFGGAANEAVGSPSCLNTTADILRERHLKLGCIELEKKAQQKGMEGLVRLLPDQTVRVFAVPPAQQNQLTPDRLAQMYGLAARERNARVLYIRPYPFDASPEKGFKDANQVFMTNLSNDLGDRIGAASLFSEPVKIQPILAAIIAFAAVLMSWAVLSEVGLRLPVSMTYGSSFAMAALTFGFGYVGPGQKWRTLLALGCASAFSLFAVIRQFDRIEKSSRQSSFSKVYWSSCACWLRMTILSLAGAWCASALLQETTFKLGIDTFRGVKFLTVVVPALVVGAWFARKGNWRPLFAALRLKIRLYHLVGFGLLGILALLYTMRTGNSGAEVAGDALETERYIRMVLDQTLGVRPRFKEFLMAHPAMLLAPLALRFGGPYLAWIFLLVGATGQAGLGDTFAHLHTPLQPSLIRSVMGGLFGYLFGSVAFWVMAWFGQKIKRLLAARPAVVAEELPEGEPHFPIDTVEP
jgi:hypothetical protein